LLPGAPGCLVLVTSRSQLAGLVATDGAYPIALDLLSPDEARELLARRIGAARTAAHPEAVAEIVTRCAQLPLALAIVAARAATNPQVPLPVLARELGDTRDRLGALTADDPATDLRAVFSWSYRTLTPEAARLFRLLGSHPGPDISAPAAASLAGLPVELVLPLLLELVQAHLISEHSLGRYAFHDLLHTYAAEQAKNTDQDADRLAAARRTLDHYLHTGHAAALLVNPHRDPIELGAPEPGTTPAPVVDHQEALAWFDAERGVLVAAAWSMAATGADRHVWQLAWTMAEFLDRRGHWQDWTATQRAAIAAAGRLGDHAAQAFAHRSVARSYRRLGQLEDAYTHYQHALGLSQHTGDLVGQAHTHMNIGMVRTRQGRHTESLDHVQRALGLYEVACHRVGQAAALNNLGWLHAQLGEYQSALAACKQSLALHQELGNEHGEADAWDSLGYVQHQLNDHAEATTCYRRALDRYRALGDRYWEANTLTHLGDTYTAAGEVDAAQQAWEQALSILDELDHPTAGELRAKLATRIGVA
jgi:tetratricopeptide (TPR) repeat protein